MVKDVGFGWVESVVGVEEDEDECWEDLSVFDYVLVDVRG